MGAVRILIVLAHPDPESFNHRLAVHAAAAAEASGHEVVLRDLYVEGFDPILPAAEQHRGAALPEQIQQACADVAEADGIVVVHPNWWGMPPAILAGWIDRALRPGVAYAFRATDSGEGVPLGLLRARTAVVLNTANTMPEREQHVFGDPLQRIWRDCIFGLCGVDDVRRRTFTPMVVSTPEQRDGWLDEAYGLIRGAFPPP